MITVKDIIRQYLEWQEFDGLACATCSCLLEDLYACDQFDDSCYPARRVPCNCGDDCEWGRDNLHMAQVTADEAKELWRKHKEKTMAEYILCTCVECTETREQGRTEPTTLQRCVEFFEKHGWPGRLRYKAGRHWYLCHHYSDTSVDAQLNDDEAAPIIKEDLKRRIRAAVASVRIESAGSRHTIYSKSMHLEGRDELALLLQAAEEAMK